MRLGELDKAHAAIDYFMSHRRPRHWNHWAEVIYRDPLTPRFIGDAPHGWVGSDFLRSVRNLFVYERDNALVLAAGIKPDWLDKGVSIRNLPTYFGRLSLTAHRESVGSDSLGGAQPIGQEIYQVVYQIDGTVTCPMYLAVGALGCAAGTTGKMAGHVTINGELADLQDGMVCIKTLPARVVVSAV